MANRASQSRHVSNKTPKRLDRQGRLTDTARQYTGGGDNAIVDGIRGTINFASGEWQGDQGKTYEATSICSVRPRSSELGGKIFTGRRAVDMDADRIEFEVSSDGTNLSKVAEIKTGFPQTDMTPTIKRIHGKRSRPTKARYVRIHAYNFGKIPAWHPGAGGDPWIFMDEIIIE